MGDVKVDIKCQAALDMGTNSLCCTSAKLFNCLCAMEYLCFLFTSSVSQKKHAEERYTKTKRSKENNEPYKSMTREVRNSLPNI